MILFDESLRDTDEEEEAELSQAMDKYRYDAMQVLRFRRGGVYAVPVGSVIRVHERLSFLRLPCGATATPFRVIHHWQEWGDGVRLLRPGVMAHGPGGLRVGVYSLYIVW